MSNHEIYSERQIEEARRANLLEYFERQGEKCERQKDEYHVRGFGGLYVNPEKGSWYLFSAEKGGFNSIDCLREIYGLSFKEAVSSLVGRGEIPTNSMPKKMPTKVKEKTAFIEPNNAKNIKKIFAFLCATRKLEPKLISKLISERKLYQDENGNAVFPHFDTNGKMNGAELQGTYVKTNPETKEIERFQGVATGTRDTVFQINVGEPEKVYVFESSIDLLSFYQMADKNKLNNAALVSMGGLKKGSLKTFVEQGLKLISCVDNDEKGKKFNASMNLKNCGILEKENVKDWNELLQKRHEILQQQNKNHLNSDYQKQQKNKKVAR